MGLPTADSFVFSCFFLAIFFSTATDPVADMRKNHLSIFDRIPKKLRAFLLMTQFILPDPGMLKIEDEFPIWRNLVCLQGA